MDKNNVTNFTWNFLVKFTFDELVAHHSRLVIKIKMAEANSGVVMKLPSRVGMNFEVLHKRGKGHVVKSNLTKW